MSPELKRLLYAYNDKYGETHLSRIHRTEYVAIAKTKRKEVIWMLVNELKKRGKDINYFESNSFQGDLAGFFFPSDATEGFTKDKIKGAQAVVFRELNEILPKVFPQEDLFEGEMERQPAAKEKTPEDATKEKVIVREDVTAAPYHADNTSVIDEDFMRQLREAENE
jgi:hypothetical protein